MDVRVTPAGDKAYRLVVVGRPERGEPLVLWIFKAHLVKLEGDLFLDLSLAFNSGSDFFDDVLPTRTVGLVKQLRPMPVVAFMDLMYLEKYAPTVFQPPLLKEKKGGKLRTLSTKELEQFLREAVKRGAFHSSEAWKPSKATALHFAAAQGDTKEIQQLIKTGVDVNVRDQEDRTPLHWAGEFKRKKAFAQLIAAGADINAADDSGITPLHLAAALDDTNLVRTLLAKGARANVKGKDDRTPLHEAAASGSVGAVRLLFTKGAEINVKDKYDERTPLQAAAASGAVKVVQFLLAKGAEVNAKDKYGGTPLHSGAGSGSVGVVELLLNKGAQVNAKLISNTPGRETHHAGETPLHAAARSGSVRVVKLLLNKGADSISADAFGETPLYEAVTAGWIDVVELLLARDVAIDAWALQEAAKKARTAILETLFTHGADINMKVRWGQTLLNSGATSGSTDVVEFLPRVVTPL
jgi:ankyrin repeat protein